MKIDHITFVAKSLEQANQYAQEKFGVRIPAGGRHPLMGTHNLLTRIAPDVFLEFIAIDPEASAPDRSRWFALDRLEREGALEDSPKLFGWVASLPDLTSKAADFSDMETIAVSRGDLRWDFCLRKDGEAQDDGVFPALINWEGGRSPVDRMQAVGIELVRLRLAHPDMRSIHQRMKNLGWSGDVAANRHMQLDQADAPLLQLELRTPKGWVQIDHRIGRPMT